jgi:CBS domain-containing protein
MARARTFVIDFGALRRRMQGLLIRQGGQSAVEYAVLLGLLLLTLGSGAVWLGGISSHSLSPLAGEMPATPHADQAAGNSVAASTDGLHRESTRGSGDGGRQVPWVLFALSVAMSGFAWRLWIRRRCRCKQPAAPPDGVEPIDLQERFSAKRQDLLRRLIQDPSIMFRNQLAVRHLMTTDIITVSPGTTKQRTREIMLESHIRHLLVCGPDRQLLGIVSDRDLCGKHGTTAGDLMNTRLKAMSSDTLISPATTHLLQSGVSSLPVVEDGRLCGILTTTDLILALQCLLQLWLHTAGTMQSEAWEQEFMQTVQEQLDVADADTCRGVKGLFEALMDRDPSSLEETPVSGGGGN